MLRLVPDEPAVREFALLPALGEEGALEADTAAATAGDPGATTVVVVGCGGAREAAADDRRKTETTL